MDIEAPYREYGPALLAYLCARLTRSVAEEIHHDVWVTALEHTLTLRGNDLRRWLFRVTRNALLDYTKKASTRRERAGLDGFDTSSSRRGDQAVLDTEELITALHECIEGLPEIFQKVVRGKLSGESPDDLAKSLGISRATVDSRFYRAKELLAECTGANEV
jgi:RNA polymerase sigma-70 factor, ECF subfamily